MCLHSIQRIYDVSGRYLHWRQDCIVRKTRKVMTGVERMRSRNTTFFVELSKVFAWENHQLPSLPYISLLQVKKSKGRRKWLKEENHGGRRKWRRRESLIVFPSQETRQRLIFRLKTHEESYQPWGRERNRHTHHTWQAKRVHQRQQIGSYILLTLFSRRETRTSTPQPDDKRVECREKRGLRDNVSFPRLRFFHCLANIFLFLGSLFLFLSVYLVLKPRKCVG